jgi:acyl phosphate:glycerol-3-phosphate acyltransferase
LTLWLCLLAFFLGALPFGFWAGRLRGMDIRDHGSGNIGATNVLRVLGPAWGYPVLLLDALKGYVPVALAGGARLPAEWIVGVGLCAVLGHVYSPFVNFRGGKGVATALGVVIGFSPLAAGAGLAVFLLTVLTTRWVSLGSMLAAIAVAVAFFLLPPNTLPENPWPFRLFGIAVAVFIVARHRANIGRIVKGTESRFGESKADPPAGNGDGAGESSGGDGGA